MSQGGLLDLVAKGAQDVYLTSKPEMTFFKKKHKRYTNFTKITTNLNFEGNIDFGTKNICKIKRDGDLLGRVYLKMKFPAISEDDIDTTDDKTDLYIRWSESPGYSIIENISIKIGGQEIDKQDGIYMQIWSDITDDQEVKLCLLGNKTYMIQPLKNQPSTTVYAPLKFWFCESFSQHLPLISLQYHEIEIEVELKSFHSMYQILRKVGPKAYDYTNYKLKSKKLIDVNLTCNYFLLDVEERKKFAQNNHEYLIHQVQKIKHTVQGNTSIPLTFNHPTKELLWVMQLDSIKNKNELFNFSGQGLYDEDNLPVNLKYNMYLRPHLLSEAKIKLNNIDRTDWQDNVFYYFVQNYDSHKNCAEHFAYLYSFAINPTDINQPSGSLNFSRIDNAELQLRVNESIVNGNNQSTIYVYAINYNVLRIQSGMGGLAYSN